MIESINTSFFAGATNVGLCKKWLFLARSGYEHGFYELRGSEVSNRRKSRSNDESLSHIAKVCMENDFVRYNYKTEA
jgi:hypothetical protein